MDEKPNNTIFLLKQSDSIDDIIKFVIDLSVSIQVRPLKFQFIIVEAIVDGITITYICDELSYSYTNEQITKCLKNMYSAAIKLNINESNNM